MPASPNVRGQPGRTTKGRGVKQNIKGDPPMAIFAPTDNHAGLSRALGRRHPMRWAKAAALSCLLAPTGVWAQSAPAAATQESGAVSTPPAAAETPAPPATAPLAQAGVLDEITVSARKKQETIRDVPVGHHGLLRDGDREPEHPVVHRLCHQDAEHDVFVRHRQLGLRRFAHHRHPRHLRIRHHRRLHRRHAGARQPGSARRRHRSHRDPQGAAGHAVRPELAGRQPALDHRRSPRRARTTCTTR